MHLKSVKLGTILAMAAGLAALAAGLLHTLSLRAPMAERRAALIAHAEYLNAAPVTMFDGVAAMNAASVELFRARIDAGRPVTLFQQYDEAFPRFGDGTRRSVDALFEGGMGNDGTPVQGVGAFLGDAETMSADQEFWFMSGYETIRRVGPQYVAPGSSLYYFTPDRRMVMYAPYREDGLSFYRHTAPADFNLRADEDPILFGADTNPRRELQCTRLSFFISSEGGERSAMACRTPVWQGDVLLGAFGSSFEVGDILAAATSEVPAGGAVWVLNAQGHVIARNSEIGAGGREFNPETLAPEHAMARQFHTARMRGSLFAFVPIPHANWTLIVRTPVADVVDAVRLRSFATFLVLFGLLSLLGSIATGHLPGLRPLREQPPAPRTE